MMDEAAVLAMLARSEGETIEFKKSLAETKEALHTLAAFASQRGGTVIFGVSPQGKVAGVDIGANTLENLAAAVGSTVHPQSSHQSTIGPSKGRRSSRSR